MIPPRRPSLYFVVLLVVGACASGTTSRGSGGSGVGSGTSLTCSGLSACVPGSYPVCDWDGHPDGPCCNVGTGGPNPSGQCVVPAGILLHSPACDELCGTTAADMSSCALSPGGSLTCCMGSACQAVVP